MTSILTLLFIVSIRGMLLAASPEEDARFLAAVKAAYSGKDAKAMEALYCWDEVPAETKSYLVATFRSEVQRPVESLKFINRPLKPRWVSHGTTWENNLPTIKLLEVRYRGDKLATKEWIFTDYSVGEKNGELFLTYKKLVTLDK